MRCIIKTVLVIAIIFLANANLYGQYQWEAKVKLNNSTKLTGYLAEPSIGENFYLHQADSTTLLIDAIDIYSISIKRNKNFDWDTKRSKTLYYPYFSDSNGFYHQIFAGSSFGEEEVNLSLGLINGYRFNKLLSLGVGINYDRFDHVAALPVYFQPRIYLKNEKVSIYYFTDLGYAAAWRNKEPSNPFEKVTVKGGLMGQVGIGYTINFPKSALNFTLGYKLQKLHTHYEYFSQRFDSWGSPEPVKILDLEENRQIRRIAFSFGYVL